MVNMLYQNISEHIMVILMTIKLHLKNVLYVPEFKKEFNFYRLFK